jgi:inhibitor of cysteine peptidase
LIEAGPIAILKGVRPAKLIGAVALIFLAEGIDMTPAQPSSPAIRVIDDGSAGGSVELPLGRALEVELGANPSTGYTWRFAAGNPSLLRLKSRRFQPAATALLPGSGGKDLFLFETTTPGTEQLHFEYRRGQTGEPARTYDLRVTVVP